MKKQLYYFIIALLTISTAVAYTQTNYSSVGTTSVYTVTDNGVLYVRMWSGGGGGGAVNTNNNANAGGGGGGAYAERYINVTAGQQFTIFIGQQGAGASTTATAIGGTGTNVSFNGTNVSLNLTGGTGGASQIAAGVGAGGTGGVNATSTTGWTYYAGGAGGVGVSSGSGGGGGGAAGEYGPGGAPVYNASSLTSVGGIGNGSLSGMGGNGSNSGVNGANGNSIGGGAAGARSTGASKSGGNGALGQVTLNLYVAGGVNVNIYDESTGLYITNLVNLTVSPITGSGGDTNYTFNGTGVVDNLSVGNYSFKFSGGGYTLRTYPVSITNNTIQTLNAYLTTSTSSNILYVRDSVTSAQLQGALVTVSRSINGTVRVVDSKYTDITGAALSYYVANARYQFTISLSGYSNLTFYLDPILLSSYTIPLVAATSTVNNTQGYAGISISTLPAIYYDASTNNFSITFNAPYQNLITHGYNASFPGGNVSGAGSSANGSTLNNTINITGATLGSTVNLTYYYLSSNTGQTLTYRTSIPIITSTSSYANNTWANSCNTNYGVGEFEKTVIGTGAVGILSGTAGAMLGAEAGGIVFVVMTYVMYKMCIFSLWTIVIPIMTGVLLLWLGTRL